MPDIRIDANGRHRDARGRFVSAPPDPDPRVGLLARITGYSATSDWRLRHHVPLGEVVRIVERFPTYGPHPEVVWGISRSPYTSGRGADLYVSAADFQVLPPNPQCPVNCPDRCPECDDGLRLCTGRRHVVPQGELCTICEERCQECEEPCLSTRMVALAFNGRTIHVCRECRQTYYASCDECGRWYSTEEGHADCPYFHTCRACEEGRFRPGDRVIDSYSYQPDFRFYGDGPLFYGLEMEMEIPQGGPRVSVVARHLLNSIGDTVMAKSDGSLYNGIELVTHPMSFDYAMGHDRLWSALDSIRDSFNVDNAERAGLHIHVSRDGFSGPSHVYRWIKFFHRNESDICRIARRRDSGWARFTPEQREWAAHIAKHGQMASTTAPGPAWYAQRKVRQFGWEDGERYRAINNTNSDTFEVRVFAGSVYPSEIRAALQLVHGSIEYTRTAPTKKLIESRFGWDGFIDWARDGGGMFRDLLDLDSTAISIPDSDDSDDSDSDRCTCALCNY